MKPSTTISNIWHNATTPPKDYGMYRVKFKCGGEGLAHWTSNAAGKKVWLVYGNREVVAYQPIIQNL